MAQHAQREGSEEEGEEVVSGRNRYGVIHFMSDIVLTCLTGGLWLIRIFVRETRNKS